MGAPDRQGGIGERHFPGGEYGGRPLRALSSGRCGGRPDRRPQLVGSRRVRMTYVELQIATHFSFLRGVSSAEELFAAARLLGYSALGITDRNTVGGLVQALRAEDETGGLGSASCRERGGQYV